MSRTLDRRARSGQAAPHYGCIDRNPRGICVTYGAMQSRHFDARVLTDPDRVYEKLQRSSDPGFIRIQSASR